MASELTPLDRGAERGMEPAMEYSVGSKSNSAVGGQRGTTSCGSTVEPDSYGLIPAELPIDPESLLPTIERKGENMDKQVSAPTRPCLSCGGLGTAASSGHMTLRGFVRDSCPVCLGSGRVDAKPSVRDAVADAETLRQNVGINDYSPEFQCWVGSPSTYALNRAVQNADMAVRGALDFCRERGELAARAAFRAVPGLRGE